VGEALNSAGIKWSSQDWIVPSPETPLKAVNQIFLSRMRTVSVVIGDGIKQSVQIYRTTVADALKKGGVPLSTIDIVNPERDVFLREGDTIKITRVTEETRVETEEQDAPVKVQFDKSMLLGEEKVTNPGQNKITAVTVKIHSENGKEISRKIVKKEVIQEAQPKLVIRGTKVVVLGVETGRASWYNADTKTTAHRTLPFGTKLRVTNTETGAAIIVKVADRGPYVDGRVVDLSADAFRALAPLSTGTMPVRVEQLQ